MHAYIRKHIEQHFPAYRALLLEHAQRAYAQSFQFSMPWDMEPTWIAHQFKTDIDWDFQMGEDPEWTFMLSRSAFVLHLAQGFILTGKEEWAQKATWYIHDFLRQAPYEVGREATSWRSLDAAMRLMNWIDAMTLLDELDDPVFIAGVQMHIDYLSSKESTFLTHSNWGIIGNAGLFKASLLLRDEELAALAETRVVESLQVQVYSDGMHWEQSPLYHAEVLNALLTMIKAAGDYGWALHADINRNAKRMGRFLLGSIKPNRHQFLQSDSDDTDVRDLLTRCSFILDDSALWLGCYDDLEPVSAFFASEDEIRAFRSCQRTEVPFLSYAALESGNVYLRSGWERDASCVHFRSGALGSGHGHADLLHVDVVAHGIDVLVDSGRYTYCETEERLALKGVASHSTILVDGLESTVCTGTWSYGRKALAGPRGFKQEGDWAWSSATHFGYLLGFEKPLVIEREVMLLGKDLVIIHDTMLSNFEHDYTWFFHFSPQGKATLSDGKVLYEAQGMHATLHLPPGSSQMKSSGYSSHYNIMQSKETLEFSYSATGLTSALFVLHACARAEGEACVVEEIPVYHEKAMTRCQVQDGRAWQIQYGDSQPIQLIFRYQECLDGVDLLATQGIRTYGRSVVHQGQRTVIFKA